MLHTFRHIVALIACIALVSCNSVYYLQIETMEPAQVTLLSEDGGGSRLMLVNNTVSQPENIGFESVAKGGTEMPIHFSPNFIDTIILGGTKHMGRILEDTHFFDAIYFYNQPVRQDAQWMSILPLSERVVNQLHGESGCDVVISIDRVLYLYKQEVAFTPYGTAHVDLKSRATLNYSVYHCGQPNKTNSLVITDSLDFYLVDVETDSANLARIPESFIHENTVNLFDKVAHSFMPQWKTAKRTLYANSSARMQEALAYAKNEHWKQAAELWLALYASEKKPIARARLAQNIAISFEVRDDIPAAIQWMEKCKEYYMQSNKTNPNELATANDYFQALQQRMIDNKLLDIQLK